MILQRLHLLHFKSIASASCTFSPKVNCFIGLNGMGKTNLLDALHYLSFTKSHLSITDSLAVQYGQEAAVLDAVYRSDFGDERQLLLQIRPGHRKVLKRNKKEYPKLSDHIGAFPLVIVSPQDYQLILGGSDERRRFVDKQLSQQDSVYMAALAQYHRILEQRNVLLKSQRADDAVLEVLDLQLEQVSPLLYERRAAFVRDFIPLFQQYYTAISGGQDRVSLVYRRRSLSIRAIASSSCVRPVSVTASWAIRLWGCTRTTCRCSLAKSSSTRSGAKGRIRPSSSR